MRTLMIAVAAWSSAAIAQSAQFTPEQRADGERQVVAAGKMLADKLRNPASARFRNIFLFKTVGTDNLEHVLFCGEVNAENGYGGMTGFERFTLVRNSLLTGSTGILNASMVCDSRTPRVHDSRDYSPELRVAFDSNAGR